MLENLENGFLNLGFNKAGLTPCGQEWNRDHEDYPAYSLAKLSSSSLSKEGFDLAVGDSICVSDII